MLFILLLTIAACEGETNFGQWSINQKGLSDSMLGYRAHVQSSLVYHEDYRADYTFVEWVVTGGCDVVMNTSTEAALTCTEGVHSISVVMEDAGTDDIVTETRSLRFIDDPYCYQWYSHVRYSDLRLVSLKLWIADPQNESADEETGFAHMPSRDSLRLTNLFHSRGIQPSLREISPQPKEELLLGDIHYSSEGYWTVAIQIGQKMQYVLRVDGTIGLTVNRCFVGSADVLISPPKYTIGPAPGGGVKLTAGRSMATCKDPCALHVAVMIKHDVLFTQDGFKTTSWLYAPPDLIQEGDVIVDCAFSSDKLYFLLESGRLLYLSSDGTFTNLHGVDNEGLASIRGKTACSPSVSPNPEEILAWNTDRMLLVSGDDTLTELFIANELMRNNTENGRVHYMDAAFTIDATSVTVMVNINDSVGPPAVAFVSYSLRGHEWTRLPFWLENHSHRTFGLEAFIRGVSDVIFWSENVLFYSEFQGTSRGIFAVVHRSDRAPNLTDSDEIQIIEACPNGDFFVQVSPSGAIYLGKWADKVLIQITHLMNDSFIFCDFSGSAYYIQYFGNTDTVVQPVTKNADSITALYPVQQDYPCKVIHFEGMSDLKSIYYLDRSEILYFWSRLVHRSNCFNSIEVSSSELDFIQVERSDVTVHSRGKRAINTTVAIRSTAVFDGLYYNTTLSRAIGIFTVRMKPLKTGLGCIVQRPVVAHLSVGCPPDKHIVLEKPQNCEVLETFILPSGAYLDDNDEPATESKVTVLDQSEFGCPLLATHETTLKPVMHLYDGDQYVEEVAADYVVYELQRRTDFTYSATEGTVGCRSAAQSWARMKDTTGDDSPDIWGPHNYISCFRNDGISGTTSLASPYEILNKTGISALGWNKADTDQLYLFHVKVIDPHYSFCRLEGKFAVVVEGAAVGVKASGNVTLLFFVGFALLTFSLGIASYIAYRDKHIEEWKRVQDFDGDDNAGFDEDKGEELSEKEEERMAHHHRRQHTLRSLTGE